MKQSDKLKGIQYMLSPLFMLSRK